MRRLLLMVILPALASAQDVQPSATSGEVQNLPAFKVAEPRAADFLLHYGPIEKTAGPHATLGPFSGPTRMWLTQWPRPKGSGGVRFPPDTAMNVDAAYRGHGLKDGDEIVRVSGRLLTDMRPGECVKLFYGSVRDPDKLSVEVEVQAKGEKSVRKVIVTKAPFNEVIVAKPPVKLDTPFPFPEPTLPTEVSRTGK